MEIKELVEIIDRYYPPDIALNDPRIKANNLYTKLSKACMDAKNDQKQWHVFLADIKKKQILK